MRSPARSIPLFALCAALAAQDAALGADEAKVRWVDGRPMLRVTLRAGDKLYPCHLLLDLSASQPLYLHRNAGGSLRAESCDVEADGITLRDVPFTAKRDTWLEGLTASYAEELAQVPVAGILGLGAFPTRDVVLDGPRAVLKLRPATSADAEPPPPSPTLVSVALDQPVASGIRLRCDLGQGTTAKLGLHTRDPFSWLAPDLAAMAGHPDGVLTTASAARGLDFARYAPFRPLRSQAGNEGGIGGATLRQMTLTIMPTAQRVVFALPERPAYPAVEAAFYRALHGGEPARLQEFLAAHPDAPQAGEAAATLLARLLEHDGEADALRDAGLAVVRTAPANKKGTAALEVLEQLPAERELFAARAAIAKAGLELARSDEDGNAAHKLRLELGSQARVLGQHKEARAHLLSVVFGMPASGAANLQLGHLHRDQGDLEGALGRYFLAILDARATGQEGYAAFAQTFAKARGAQADLLAELEDRADGRVASFQPIPREPGTIQKTGRTVLVELFTGAMCPPCVAADVGCDGLTQLFDRDEVVLLQWHLPVPQPEPLVADASLTRAERLGVRSTPTVIIAGGEPIVGGGKADAAPDMFRRYREAIEPELRQAPQLRIDGHAALRGDLLDGTVSVTSSAGANPKTWRLHAVLVERTIAFPGSNGVLFHHDVVRAALLDGASVAEPTALRINLADVARALDTRVSGYESDKAFLVRPVTPDRARLHVVAFVEDGDDVLQAQVIPLQMEAAK